MKYILILLLGLITLQVSAQKIIQAGSFATGSALADTAAAIRASLPIDTSFTIEDTGFYTVADSFDITRFRNITVSLVAAADTAARISFPAADASYEGITFYIQGAYGEGSTQAVFFNSDLNGVDVLLNIGDGETVMIKVAESNGAWIWIAIKSSSFTDRNGIISALPDGDVDIDGATSSDLRIRDTRIQFDARMKIGTDSSFIHDPVADTTVIKGDIVLGKFCTNNTYPFSMRNAANASTTLLVESGASTGFGAIKLLSYNLPSKIEYGSTTSSYLNFYNAKSSRNGLQLGTLTNARTVLIGYTDSGVNWGSNGALVVYDTVSSGKGLVTFKKVSSNSTPILTLSSASNDRHVFHDDGRVFFNNLGTGTATQTLGLTSSGQVVPYTQVYPTAHVSAIDADVNITTQVNASITTYVSYYLSTTGTRTLTFPTPSSTLAGRSIVVSYSASGYSGYTVIFQPTSGNLWYAGPTTGVPASQSSDGWNVSQFATITYVCRQVNGTWYWVRDSYFDMFVGQTWAGSVTGISGATVTFSNGIPDAPYSAAKLEVFKNGVRIFAGDGYTVSDNSPLTLTVSTLSVSGDKWNFKHTY